MTWKYTFQKEYEPERMARASATHLPVSYKHSREICGFLNGKGLNYAMTYLKGVINLQCPVPFKHYVRDVGHKRGMASGRYPVKASKFILKLLENVLANANAKGLDDNRLIISHFVTHQAIAHNKRRGKLSHVEVLVEEKEEEDVKRNPEKKVVKPKKEAKKESLKEEKEAVKDDLIDDTIKEESEEAVEEVVIKDAEETSVEKSVETDVKEELKEEGKPTDEDAVHEVSEELASGEVREE